MGPAPPRPRCTDPGVGGRCATRSRRGAVNASLQRLSHEPGVAGVRQLIQDEHEGFALQPRSWTPSTGRPVRADGRPLRAEPPDRGGDEARRTLPGGDIRARPLRQAGRRSWPMDRWLQTSKPWHTWTTSAASCPAYHRGDDGTRGTNKIRRYLRAAVDAFGRTAACSAATGPMPASHLLRRVGFPRPRLCVGPRRARDGIESCGARRWRSTHGPGSPDEDQLDRKPPAAHA